MELGQWASVYYMSKSIQKFSDVIQAKQAMPLKRNGEDELLLQQLQRLHDSQSADEIATGSFQMAITEKVQKLIHFLTTRDEAQRHGIIFVEQRATVAMLSELLSIYPTTKDVIRCGTFVGSSTHSERKAAIGDWLDSSEQQDTLEEFRLRHKNLIIATSVLEEGIDISACNVVICFNKPANLKSFIQRRGRARKHYSTYVLMLSSDDVALDGWDSLEQMMVELYQKDVAEREDIRALEDVEEFSDSRFEVQSTGYSSPRLETSSSADVPGLCLPLIQRWPIYITFVQPCRHSLTWTCGQPSISARKGMASTLWQPSHYPIAWIPW
jgi:ERCC4-related helicase